MSKQMATERAEMRETGFYSATGREFVKKEDYRHANGFTRTALYYRENGTLYREDLGYPGTRKEVLG
jgi:hypothetical protein